MHAFDEAFVLSIHDYDEKQMNLEEVDALCLASKIRRDSLI
ncbi:hypothetical protein [Undibacterium sp. Xuan67W]